MKLEEGRGTAFLRLGKIPVVRWGGFDAAAMQEISASRGSLEKIRRGKCGRKKRSLRQ